MRFGVLGTGPVGATIGTKLVQLGHEVTMGARSADNEKAASWAAAAGTAAGNGAFADAAASAEVVFNCTSGMASLAALDAAGAANLDGKVLVDVANPLDFSRGMPPTLSVANDDSLGEQIQRAFPAARVVKALNTVTAGVMVEPEKVPGRHNIFMCGNDSDAKGTVEGVLGSFGWPDENIVDLGAITGARAMEMYLPLWLRLMGVLGTADFNIGVVR